MLHMPRFSPVVTPSRVVTGPELNKLVKNASPRERAQIAADLVQGTLQVSSHTYKQAATLAHVSFGYTATASALTPEERAQLARGTLSMSRLHRRRRRADAELDRIVEQFGADAIWRALERYTQPDCGVTVAEIVD